MTASPPALFLFAQLVFPMTPPIQWFSDSSSENKLIRAATSAATFTTIALVVAFTGLFAAGLLSAGHVLDLPVPCGRSRGCLAVAMHPASKLFGVPIAFVGVAAYLTMIWLLTRAAEARWARVGCLAMAGLGTVISAGLLYYSRTVIHATCAWCLASGISMTLLFLLSFVLLKDRQAWKPLRPAIVWSLALLTATAIGVQGGLMQRAATRPPISADRLAGITSGELIDPAQSLGPGNAPVTVVVFADLWCPACRAAYGSLLHFQQAHPAAVRLVYRHLPLYEIRGHEFSGTAAALSEIAAEEGKFWPFVDALHRRKHPLNATGYLELLAGLRLGTTNVEERLSRPEDPAVKRVQRDMVLAERLGIHTTPTFIVLVDDYRPVSATQRTLPTLLNSPAVRSKLVPGEQLHATQ